MLPKVKELLKLSSGVKALLGNDPRVYRHGEAPQKVVAPYVTWYAFGTPENTLSERPAVDRYTVQIDCWSNNTGTGDEEVESLARAVRDAIEGRFHMTGLPVDGRDPDTRRYRITMLFTFWEQRTEALIT